MTAAPATTTLLTFGETMGLISAHRIGTLDVAREASIGIGGAETNVAIGVARLGQPVTWIGRIGNDAVGDLIERRLNAEGIATIAIRDGSFTGLMMRHTRAGTAVHVDYHRRGSAASRLTPSDIPRSLISSAAILHVTGITPALSPTARETVLASISAATSFGVTVSVDINYRSKLWDRDTARPTLTTMMAGTDIVFAGIEEAQLVLGTSSRDPLELARGLRELGPTEVVIKNGDQGCVAIIDGVRNTQPAIPVTVIDPVGAGDAFVAGYLAEHLAGAGAGHRLRTAVAMGAYAVTVPGDCELLPSRSDLAAAAVTDVVR